MDGVILTSLKQIQTSKGDVFHAMKKTDAGFDGFGEVYFSTVNQNDIKGWKKHTKMTLNLIVPVGAIRFVIYNEKTEEFFDVELSLKNYQRLTVKPGLWLSFQGKDDVNMLANIASIEHDANESELNDLEGIRYDW